MRNVRIALLLTPEENSQIQREAETVGLPLSTFIRLAVMEKMNAANAANQSN